MPSPLNQRMTMKSATNNTYRIVRSGANYAGKTLYSVKSGETILLTTVNIVYAKQYVDASYAGDAAYVAAK